MQILLLQNSTTVISAMAIGKQLMKLSLHMANRNPSRRTFKEEKMWHMHLQGLHALLASSIYRQAGLSALPFTIATAGYLLADRFLFNYTHE